MATEANRDNLQGIYNSLKTEGYTPPDFETFVKDMQDENNLRGVYETLKTEGYTPPEFDVFRRDMFGEVQPVQKGATGVGVVNTAPAAGTAENNSTVAPMDANVAQGMATTPPQPMTPAQPTTQAQGGQEDPKNVILKNINYNPEAFNLPVAQAPASINGNIVKAQGAQGGWQPMEMSTEDVASITGSAGKKIGGFVNNLMSTASGGRQGIEQVNENSWMNNPILSVFYGKKDLQVNNSTESGSAKSDGAQADSSQVERVYKTDNKGREYYIENGQRIYSLGNGAARAISYTNDENYILYANKNGVDIEIPGSEVEKTGWIDWLNAHAEDGLKLYMYEDILGDRKLVPLEKVRDNIKAGWTISGGKKKGHGKGADVVIENNPLQRNKNADKSIMLNVNGYDVRIPYNEVLAYGGLENWVAAHDDGKSNIEVYVKSGSQVWREPYKNADVKSYNFYAPVEGTENGYAAAHDLVWIGMEDVWRQAQKEYNDASDANAKVYQGAPSYTQAAAGLVTLKDDIVAELNAYDLDKMSNRLWAQSGARVAELIYNDLAKMYQADESELRKFAEERARELCGRVLYDYVKRKEAPQNALDYLMRTVVKENLLYNLAKGVAAKQTNGKGKDAITETAEQEYVDGKPLLRGIGTGIGIAVDPTTWLSGGIGKVVGRGVTNLVGRLVAPGVAKNVVVRYVGSKWWGKAIQSISAGSANFTVFEGLNNADRQFANRGVYNPETGQFEFRIGDIFSAAGRGAVLGAAMGGTGAFFGNASVAVSRNFSSTAAKAAVYTTSGTLSFGTEAFIFTLPEILEGKEDAWDLWTESALSLWGIKAVHYPQKLYTAGKRMAELRKKGKPAWSVIRENIAKHEQPMWFTDNELRELSDKGYENAIELFNRAKGGDNVAEQGEYAQYTKELRDKEYDDLAKLIEDKNVSQAVRSKAYFFLTNKALPISTILDYKVTETEDGSVRVETFGQDGSVVTSSVFKDAESAQDEVAVVKRQKEVNQIAIGQGVHDDNIMRDCLAQALTRVAGKYGFDLSTEEGLFAAIDRYNKAVSVEGEITDGMAKEVHNVLKTIAEDSKDDFSAGLKSRIEAQYGVHLDDILGKSPREITDNEQAAIDEYITRLYEGTAQEAEAVAKLEQRAKERQEGEDAQERRTEGAANEEIKVGETEEQAGAEMSDATERYRRAYEEVEDVFGVNADEVFARLEDDPWNVINDMRLTEAEQEAVIELFSAKQALRAEDGTIDPMANKATGQRQPLLMKNGVEVFHIDGKLVMLPDGSGVDVAKSDSKIIVYDPKTGKYKFASIDMIDRLGETAERSEHSEGDSLETMSEGSERSEVTESAELRVKSDESDSSEKSEVSEVSELAEEKETVAKTEPQQPNNAVSDDSLHSGGVENGITPTEPNGESTVSGDKGSEKTGDDQTTALGRVPVGEDGKRRWTAVDAETAWDGLMESTEGDADMAQRFAQMQVESAKKKVTAAKRVKVKETDDIEAFKAADGERKRAIAEAEAEQARWEAIAGEKARRDAEVERMRIAEEEARREAERREEERMAREAAEKAERERLEREERSRREREALEGVPDASVDRPADARARGYKRVDGQMIARQPEVEDYHPGMGNEVTPIFKSGAQPVRAKGRVFIGEVDEFQAAHKEGRPNALHFLPEGQPKDRARDGGVSEETARTNAENLDIALITRTEDAYAGAPTLNRRQEAIQGNNRVRTLQMLYERYPEKAAQYRQWLIDNAERLGVDPEYVRSLKRPAMGMVLDVDDAEAIRLGQMTSADNESGGKRGIEPKHTAAKMGENMQGFAQMLLSGDEDASITQLIVEGNGVRVLKWMRERGYIDDTQYGSALRADGKLTETAVNDLKNILYQAIFQGDNPNLEDMFRKLPDKVQKALLATAFRDYNSPEGERMLGEIQSSIKAFTVLMGDGNFREATNYETARMAVEAWKRQTTFDDVTYESSLPSKGFSNFALTLAAIYKGHKQRAIQKIFNDIYDKVQGVNASMFDEASGEKALVEAVKEVLGIEYEPIKRNNDGQNGSMALDNDYREGEAGRQGSTGDVGSRKPGTDGEQSAERGRGIESDGSREIEERAEPGEEGQAGKQEFEPQVVQEPIQGLEGYTREEIKGIVLSEVEGRLSDAEMDVEIVGIEIHGSRNRGDAREYSDLDVVIEYKGDIKEDSMFNVINEEPIEIEGINVDVNPIRAEQSGTLEEYMEGSRKYDAELLQKGEASEAQKGVEDGVGAVMEARRRYGRRGAETQTGKSLFDWAEEQGSDEFRVQSSESEVTSGEMEAAEQANAAIDRYVEEYRNYWETTRELSEREDMSEEEKAMMEQQEDFITEARGRLEQALREFYVLNNTPQDASRIASEMAARAEAETLVRLNRPQILRDILEGKREGVTTEDETVSNEVEVRTATGLISYNAIGHLPDAKAGEFCLAERKFSRSGEFDFTGNDRIQDRGDVAYLFRALESYAIEHVFGVLVKDGRPHIVHIGMGAPTMSVADLSVLRAAYDAFGADKVYLLHNHPSGKLIPSVQDEQLMRRTTDMFTSAGVPAEGIIIDTTSGRYASFGVGKKAETPQRPAEGGNTQHEVLRFDRLDRSTGGGNAESLNTSQKVSDYVRSLRFEARPKVSYLVMNNNLEVVGHFHTDFDNFDNPALAEEMASVATKLGGNTVSVYGNCPVGYSVRNLQANLKRLSGGSVSLVDALQMNESRYWSARDDGYISETPINYGEAEGGEARFMVSSKIDELYPNWLDGTTTESGKHSTQVEGTRKTYNKVGDWIEKNMGEGVTILDASSGMGYGTRDLRERGFDIEDVEPYQSEQRKAENPATYDSYDKIDKEYDMIISNAVLNVIPDDWRANVLHDMARRLKPGGKMFINTRKAGEEKAIKDKIELDSPQEVLVKRNGRIASYQKFFTPTELKEWVESELGEGYTVEVANERNSGTKGLAAVMVTKGENVKGVGAEEGMMRDAVIEQMRDAGIEVSTDWKEGQRVLDEVNGRVALNRSKKRLLDTAPLIQKEGSPADISSNDGTKVVKNLESLAIELEKVSSWRKSILSDIAEAIGANSHGSNSKYATFETKNGNIVTIRLANHNANTATFDNHGEDNGISIVIAKRSNKGINNNGNAHLVEYYYSEIALRKAEGKPLADIVRSIQQSLYSGEFKDTTGLAEREEVNIGNVRMQLEEPVFYSNAERAVEDVKQEKATAEQWLAMLQKNGGLKAGEDKWLGLSEWLGERKGQSVTKEEILNYIRANKIEIEETHYAETSEAFEELKEECAGWIDDGGYNYAWEQLRERFGDDADMAFSIWGGELEIAEGDAAVALLGGEKPINDTRLEYTTEGLKNRREIALTVPTIESWNESDELHFGDAGEGRAVAWVRFGDTLSIRTEEAVDHVETFEEPVNGWNGSLLYYPKGAKRGSRNFVAYEQLRDGSKAYVVVVGEKRISLHETLEAAREAMNAYYSEHPRRTSNLEKVLVIDEIQSKRHQEGRENGYREDNASRLREVIGQLFAANREYEEYIAELSEKYGSNADLDERVTDTERSKINELYTKRASLEGEQRKVSAEYSGKIPDAPFAKNWHELAMKRMLRYAAEHGYDKVAWTTGEQQAERYGLGSVVDEILHYDRDYREGRIKNVRISLADGRKIYLSVDRGGKVVYANEMITEGTMLSEVVGKELAQKIMSGEGDDTTHRLHDGEVAAKSITGVGLSIGGEGMKGFYDQMLPRFMDKYGKKWGIKTHDVELPDLEDKGAVMHAVDVTEAMKESVRDGQPMFFRTRNGEAYGFTLNGKVYIDPRIATSETPVHEYHHLWAEALEKANPEAWQHLKEQLFKDRDLTEWVKSRYPDLAGNENDLAHELFAQFGGKRGNERLKREQERMEKANKDGVLGKARIVAMFNRLRKALNKYWQMARDLFAGNNKHLKDMSAEDFADMAMNDLLNKVKPGAREGEGRRDVRFDFSEGREAFDAMRDRVVAEGGIVMPGLAEKEFTVTQVPRHDFEGTGKEALQQAERWGKEHLKGEHILTDASGQKILYTISGKAIEKFVSPSATSKSVNLGVHLSVLKELPHVIGNSIETEVHPDYPKNKNGERDMSLEPSKDALVHRFYGAVEIGGEMHRIKTTILETPGNNKAYTYEVSEIEILDSKESSISVASTKDVNPVVSAKVGNNSETRKISGAELLRGVEKSYGKGAKLLDESAGKVRFQVVGSGGSLKDMVDGIKSEAERVNGEDRNAKDEAMRAIGGNLSKLRSAMARQREYDQETVKSVTDLARTLLEQGMLDDLSKGEMKRLMSTAANVTGKKETAKYVQTVVDIMVDNQLRLASQDFGRLLSIKGSKINAKGIEVQGALDPDGQAIAQVIKKTTSLSVEELNEKANEALDRMGSTDKALADQAALEYTGLKLSSQYAENITKSKNEEKELRESIRQAKEEYKSDKENGTNNYGWTKETLKQYVETTEDAIRENKIERVEAYRALVDQVNGIMRDSVDKAKAWREAETMRIAEIQHNANSDMEGRPTDEHHKPTRLDKAWNSDAARFLLAPLGTFDQMLRMFGNKSVDGEGYLWNRYMRGWLEATENEYMGYRDAVKVLDNKVSEVFGKKMRWSDLFAIDRKLPGATVRFWDGGEMKDHELSQGNLLYIYMVDKMSDGRMKLRKMGIGESDVEGIIAQLDPRFKELADWMQDEFLVNKRNEYNEVHKRMFGASMAAIENYFPLKILANARMEDIDVADDVADNIMPGTSTGAIVKRRRNNLALDITGANAFSVVLDHIQEMEKWKAFAEYNRDLNTLLSYKRFRNQVMNMKSVYGSGKTLWNKFRNASAMAAGAYRPPIAPLDKAAVNIAKGVTAAKVSFRIFTALKQFLSMPAYLADSNPKYLAANLVNPRGAWKWSMENMPLFEKRWMSRMAGDPRLLKTDMDWKAWRSRFVQLASKYGMSPNAFVDALTVSIGAHSMYQTRRDKYLRLGMEKEEAERRAKQDATILYNQTQQSSESAFLSTIQVDRSWLSVMFTVFRNSSMSYTRQAFDAARNLERRMHPGYAKEAIAFRAKQLERDGIDPEIAEKEAKREYRRGTARDLVRVAIFGYGLQLAWNLGAYLPYLIFGDDDEEKGKMLDDAVKHAMFGSIEGLTGGDVWSSAGNMLAQDEVNAEYLKKEMPISSDITSILKTLKRDKAEALNDVINLVVQSGVGVNPESLTNIVAAGIDFFGDDAQSQREYALLVTRILNCPPSQIDKIYFDEIEASAREASEMTPSQIAERYAKYKLMQSAPLTGWMRSDERKADLEDKYRKVVERKTKDVLAAYTDQQVGISTQQLDAEYQALLEIDKSISAIEDEDDRKDAREDWKCTDEYEKYMSLKKYRSIIDLLTEQLVRANKEDKQTYTNMILDIKTRVLNAANNDSWDHKIWNDCLEEIKEKVKNIKTK